MTLNFEAAQAAGRGTNANPKFHFMFDDNMQSMELTLELSDRCPP